MSRLVSTLLPLTTFLPRLSLSQCHLTQWDGQRRLTWQLVWEWQEGSLTLVALLYSMRPPFSIPPPHTT